MARSVRKSLAPQPRDPEVSLGLAVAFGWAGLVSLFIGIFGLAAEGGTWATGVYLGLAAVWICGAAGPAGWRWWRGRVGMHRLHRNLCPHCGYNLTGNVSGVCPECGDGRSL